MVRHVVDLFAEMLDVDRRTNQGVEAYAREWPVHISVPLTPMEYDALRFLSSLYPANPPEIARAALIPFLDPGAVPPGKRRDDLDRERTSRVELGLDTEEKEALDGMALAAGVSSEEMARWAMWESLGPLLQVSRP